MIPTRKFPYTDFHDLNLDWLLERFNNYDLDLDDIRRRLTTLEEWKIVIDADIVNIHNDITNISDNAITYYVAFDDSASERTNFTLHKGSVDSPALPITPATALEFLEYVQGEEAETGTNNVNVVFYGRNTEVFYTGSYYIDYNENVNLGIHFICTFENSTTIRKNTYEKFKISLNVNLVNMTATFTSTSDFLYTMVSQKQTGTMYRSQFTNDSGNAEYPYKGLFANVLNMEEYDQITLYFKSLDDFTNYSNLFASYVEVVGTIVYLYAKQIPPVDIEFDYYIGG